MMLDGVEFPRALSPGMLVQKNRECSRARGDYGYAKHQLDIWIILVRKYAIFAEELGRCPD
jgi:hypothetical protein